MHKMSRYDFLLLPLIDELEMKLFHAHFDLEILKDYEHMCTSS